MKIKVLLFLYAFYLLVACSSPTVSMTFTREVLIGTGKGAELIVVYLDTGDQPICYLTDANDFCHTENAQTMFRSGLVLSDKSGCWKATKRGDNYTTPEVC